MKISPFWWHDLKSGGESGGRPGGRPGGQIYVEPRDVPEAADVVIIGAGFTGLAAAMTFIRHGRSVVVLDSGQPGLGASTRNGGICSGNLRISHEVLAARHGLDYANRLYGEAVEARADLRTFIEAEAIECGLNRQGWLLGAMSRADYGRLSRQAEALSALPGHDIEMIPHDRITTEVNSPRFYGGMLRREIDSFHPGQFFAGLLKIARREGVVICPDNAAQDIEDDGNTKRIHHAHGMIKAGRVMVATNGYTGRIHPFTRFLRRRLVPVQSAIITTERLEGSRMAALFPQMRSASTTANLAAYFRPTPDGERVLLGARSFSTHQPSRRTVLYLQKLLTDIFPDLHNVGIEYCWLGNVAYTRGHLPAIFSHDGVTYACGYAGSGTVWARWLGCKAAEEAMGVAKTRSMFSAPPPEAIPFYDGTPWFMPLVSSYYAMRDLANEWRFGRRR